MSCPPAYTPGPWRIEADPPTRCGGPRIVNTPDAIATRRRVAIADLWDTDGILGETQANARLIAAAPELLAALQGLKRYVDACIDERNGLVPYMDAARAALAKAATGGES